jgi:transposase
VSPVVCSLFPQDRQGFSANYRKLTTTRFRLSWTVDETKVRADAASDGCRPLVTNDVAMSAAALFGAYHYQPNLECRHRLLKGPLAVAPVYLKSEFRVDALGFCYYIALLVHALLERDLRRAMTTAGIDALPLYPEDRGSRAPTATHVLDPFADLAVTHITANGKVVTTPPPQPSPLQQTILGLLDVPGSAYTGLA